VGVSLTLGVAFVGGTTAAATQDPVQMSLSSQSEQGRAATSRVLAKHLDKHSGRHDARSHAHDRNSNDPRANDSKPGSQHSAPAHQSHATGTSHSATPSHQATHPSNGGTDTKETPPATPAEDHDAKPTPAPTPHVSGDPNEHGKDCDGLGKGDGTGHDYHCTD
ncbi:MAG TPA: hypothetical protein VFK89_01535, partial [Actinomycetota bacterium]|nr:hypothetical protein [Actinomycetota bacterium]